MLSTRKQIAKKTVVKAVAQDKCERTINFAIFLYVNNIFRRMSLSF